MSDSRYSYDENAEVWPYFVLTLLSVVLIPATLIAYSRFTSKKETTDAYKSTFKPDNDADIQKYRTKLKRSSLFTKLNVFVFFGWVAFAGLIYLITIQEPSADGAKIFDPYELLGLSYSASDKDIKSSYRKLSLKYHPDKVHELGNFTREEVEARFVEITKAYKALTDEEIRENYIKYGHPDGPQETTHGIALPKWMIEGTGSPVIVSLYAIFFGVVLPWFVGKWWGSIQEYTKNGIHRDTAGLFFEEIIKDQPVFITHEKIVEFVSRAAEYKSLLPRLTPDDILELLNAHLERKTVKNELDKITVVARVPAILDGFLDIASAFKVPSLLTKIIEVRRAVIQAVPIKSLSSGELYQLPGATDAVFAATVTRVSELIKLPTAEAKKVLGTKDTAQTENAVNAAKNLPKITVLSSKFKVPGEEVVPPQSQVHLIVKFSISSPANTIPKFTEEYLEEEETDALLRNPLSNSNKGPKLPYTIAPYFPVPEHTSWEAIVSAPGDKLVDGPAALTNGIITNITKESKLVTQDDIKVNTFKLQLSMMSPQFLGSFNFDVQLLNKTYFGLDLSLKVPMVVANPPESTEPEEDVYDIPDAEEDSLAGTMAQMKGEKVSKKKENEDEEEEEEEDLSDIDTDTDAEFESDEDDADFDEEEKKKK